MFIPGEDLHEHQAFAKVHSCMRGVFRGAVRRAREDKPMQHNFRGDAHHVMRGNVAHPSSEQKPKLLDQMRAALRSDRPGTSRSQGREDHHDLHPCPEPGRQGRQESGRQPVRKEVMRVMRKPYKTPTLGIIDAKPLKSHGLSECGGGVLSGR